MLAKKSSITNPDVGSLEETEELIRKRAHVYYEERGCAHGHDLDDWLRAEADIVGHMTSQPAVADERRETAAVAA